MKRLSSRRVERSVGAALRKRSLPAVLLAVAMLGIYVYQEINPTIAVVSREVVVHDGDTLTVHGQRIRLQGIDAPELHQTCQRDGKRWACGEDATQYLKQLIGSQEVSCTDEAKDKYGRGLSYCAAGGMNLNAEMVRAGYAMAYQQYDTRFVPQEEEARAAKSGIWASRFDAPWDWRKEHSGQ